MARILAIRLSALGDVAMVIPVLQSFAEQYPSDEITLLSRPAMKNLLTQLPPNVHFRSVETEQYKSLRQLWNLYCQLRTEGYDAVADMHDVLRSKVLRFFFQTGGLRVAHIKKGRAQRYALTRHRNKKLLPLKNLPERYADVLAHLGFPVRLTVRSVFGTTLPSLPQEMQALTGEHNADWIGIAPFARHAGKVYPLDLMEQVIATLAASDRYRLFLFGFGAEETAWCQEVAEKYDHTISLVGRFDMEKELRLMAHLDAMLTMDSGNMHLAALVQTPTISVWGATHPYAGFSGLQAPGSEQVQAQMDCRPCSVYGNRPCRKGDYPCLHAVSPQVVVEAVRQVCEQNKPE